MILLFACAAPAPLPFEYAGCTDTDRGCEITGSSLRLWAAAPSLTVTAGGAPVPVTLEPIAGGVRATWASPTPGTVTVSDGQREGTLALLAAPEWAWKADMDAAKARGLAACRDAAGERLSSATDADRGGLLRALARCERSAGDPGVGGHLREAGAAYDRAGRRADAARARSAAASLLFGTDVPVSGIRELLDAVPDAAPNGEIAWLGAWHRAQLDARTGNYRAALDASDRAEAVAARLGLDSERLETRHLRAVVYSELGRFEDAIREQRAVVADSPFGPGDCGRGNEAERSTSLAWLLIEDARSRSVPPAPETIPLLESVGALHRTCGHAASDITNIEVNLALACWLAGDRAGTRAHLDAARALPVTRAEVRSWIATLEGWLALDAGDAAGAAAALEQAVVVADLRGSPSARAEALAALAGAHRALGRPDDAVRDLAAAHADLWGATGRIPIDAGAASFLSARAGITEQYVSLLLDLGRPEDALGVVRRARSHLVEAGHVQARLDALDPASRRRFDDNIGEYRALRASLEAAAGEGWDLPKDELAALKTKLDGQEAAATRALDAALALLGAPPASAPPPPRPGDVVLAWFPVRDDWIGFAATADGVRVARLGRLPADPGPALLDPFADPIRSASRIVLLPWGDLRAVDLQALPFDGAPLLARAPVVWSLDLGGTTPIVDGDRLVVADPTGDLPGARSEGEAVAAAWPGAKVLAGESATVAALRAELPRSRAWHYAGHAFYREGEAWQSGLRMADGVLRVGDVLALPRVPSEIVLSACESGRSDAAAVETWGLAQAFVARGSGVVLATSRPVADRTGAALARSLYAAGPGPFDARARAAVLALRDAGDPDWTAFRIWTP